MLSNETVDFLPFDFNERNTNRVDTLENNCNIIFKLQYISQQTELKTKQVKVRGSTN